MAHTPMKYALSSVFLTPNSENKSPVPAQSSHSTPRPLPHLAVLLSPAETPKRSPAIDAPDILIGLIEVGMPHSADLILAHLSPSDIIACTQVSQKWYEMVTSRQNLMDKATLYRKQCKSNAENMHKRVNKPFRHQSQLPRQPLSSIPPNIQLHTSNGPSSSSLPSAVGYQCRPCPHCGSPAMVLDHRGDECAVGYQDFWTSCFCRWHKDVCPPRTPKRTLSTNIAGTQMCKKRLRRL